jgi:riboflavin kinase/FMN adenylyltransferase
MIILNENKNELKEEVYLTIGNFDGVHLGHRDFLKQIKIAANESLCKLMVMTFVPHPSFVLKGTKGFLLNSYLDRRGLLTEVEVDYLFEVDFNRDFSTLSPENFLRSFIFNNDRIKKVYFGHDFGFGANKVGDFNLAKKIASEFGVELVLYSEFKLNQSKVSSSDIRSFVISGNIHIANKLLGRNFFLSGRVIKGAGRGRQIGFPTANLGYEKEMITPGNGVYVTKTTINNMVYNSLTNVGFNPTFNTGYDVHVETHLLDFSRDIYGDEIKVEFLKKLRDEVKFSSVNELVNQIETDVKTAQGYFKNV